MKTITLQAPSALDCRLATGWLLETRHHHQNQRGIVEVDLSKVRKIDSVGVFALFEVNRIYGHPSEPLRLINSQPEVAYSIEVMGVHREFLFQTQSEPSREEAESPILIIEDEGVVRSVASLALKPLGLPIIECENAIEGTKIAAREKPCLIVLDYQLPGMNGAEMLKWLNGSEDTEDIPVMMMSSNELASDVYAGAFDVASAIFRKPFSPRLFREEAARLIAGCHSAFAK